MAKKSATVEGAQFVQYFGPLLDALRTLGGSGRPSEVVEQIARDLKLSETLQTELLDSGDPRFPNQVAWARFYLARDGVPPIELVDGAKLIDMFESLELGLTPVAAYAIDFPFFDEFRIGRSWSESL